MNKEITAYETYLLNFGMVKKPQMPNFELSAYTDSEYQQAILEIMNEFDFVDFDSMSVARFIKGD